MCSRVPRAAAAPVSLLMFNDLFFFIYELKLNVFSRRGGGYMLDSLIRHITDVLDLIFISKINEVGILCLMLISLTFFFVFCSYKWVSVREASLVQQSNLI